MAKFNTKEALKKLNPLDIQGLGGQVILPVQPIKETTQQTTPTANGTAQAQTQDTAKVTKTEAIRNQETGRVTGLELPDGRFLGGLKPKDVELLLEKQRQKTELPQGTVAGGTAQAQAAKMQRMQELAQQGVLSEAELAALQEAPIDWGQALTAGAVGAAPAALGAAAGGLLAASGGLAATGIGAPVAVGTLAAAGALYALSKLWSGTKANIAAQQKGQIGAAQDVLTNAKSNIKQLKEIASADPTKAEKALELYYQQLNQVHIARRKIQLETQGNLNKFLEDGTDILSDFDLFLQPGGQADLALIRLEEAIISGKPATLDQLIRMLQEDTEE